MVNISGVLSFFIVQLVVVEASYFCLKKSQPVDIKHQRGGEIVSTHWREQYYADNTTCIWRIEAKPNERIRLSVILSDLLNVQDFGSHCEQVDHVTIMDGENQTISSWCGKDFPKEVTSQSNKLTIVFKSKANAFRKARKGLKIRFRTFDNTTCPPYWLMFENACYALTSHKTTWIKSQTECNQRQSNLLTVKSKTQFDFINKELLNKTKEDYLWVGMGRFGGDVKWIDDSKLKPYHSFIVPEKKALRDCAVVSTDTGRMYFDHCNNTLLYAVCEASKTTPTTLYHLAVYDDFSNVNYESSGQVLLGVVVTLLVLLVVGTIIGFVAYKLRNHRRRQMNCY